MRKIKYRVSLDMFEVATQTTIKAKKGDTACSIYITLTENGKVYHIAEGCHAVFSGKKPDGNYLCNSETCRIEDNTVIYDFTSQTVACEGVVECEVILYKGEDRLTSPRFNLMVDATIYNGEEIISSPEGDALKEATKNANDAAERANEAYYTTSQGRSAKYRFTSGGWKRILNIIRGSSGTINLGYGTGENYKSSQALAFDVCGFVKYPEDTNPNSAPILLKRYENSFGDDDAMATPKAKITKIRVGYPKSGTTFPNIPEGDEQDYSNSPVNCYVDVYMELDTSGLGARSCSFTMNYAGFAESHNCESILEETDATDTGIYGEELSYYTVSVADMPYYLRSDSFLDPVAPALKGSAKGNPVTITDVSPLSHKMNVKLSSKLYQKTGEAILDSTGDDGQNIYEFHSNGNEYLTDTFVTVTAATETDLSFSDGSYFFTYNEDICQLNTFASEGETVCLCTVDGITYMYKTTETDATLQTFGKNFLDINAFGLFKRREDGSYISTKKVYQNLAVNLPEGIYTYSGYIKSPEGCNYRFIFWYEDGTKQQESIASTGEYIYQSITSNGKPIKSIGFYYKNTAIIEVKDVQLELGTIATEYEPFKGSTYTADENGNAKVTSIYPTTTLYADGDTITAEYNRDLNKAFAELLAKVGG